MDGHIHIVGTPLGCHALWGSQPFGLSGVDLVDAPQSGQPRPPNSASTRPLPTRVVR